MYFQCINVSFTLLISTVQFLFSINEQLNKIVIRYFCIHYLLLVSSVEAVMYIYIY